MHLEPEQIQRLLHGELSPATADSVHDHLTSCFECQARLAEAEQEETSVLALLQNLDHSMPAKPGMIVHGTRSRAVSWYKWAAGITLVMGAAGAASAIPGLPLRGWVESAASWLTQTRPPSLSPADTASARERAVSGIMVETGEQLAIVFAAPSEGGSARIVFTQHDRAEVRALSGPATFTAEIGRLVIADYSPGTQFEIRIPRAARHVEVMVGQRRLLISEESRVRGARADATGAYTVPLGAPVD